MVESVESLPIDDTKSTKKEDKTINEDDAKKEKRQKGDNGKTKRTRGRPPKNKTLTQINPTIIQIEDEEDVPLMSLLKTKKIKKEKI